MTIAATLLSLICACSANSDEYRQTFDSPDLKGWTGLRADEWRVEEGALVSPDAGGVPGMLLSPISAGAVSIRVDVQLPAQGRRNPSIVFGMQPEGTGYMVRWYDQRDWLELIRYDRQQVIRVDGNHWQAASPGGSAPQKPSEWYTIALDAFAGRVRAKVWASDGAEPDWQLEADCPLAEAGACGLGVDETVARLDNFTVLTGFHIAEMVREERRARARERRRERSVVLSETAPEEALVSADFAVLARRAPEVDLILRAADPRNHYFVRADAVGMHIGKVVSGREVLLATIQREWFRGAGRYRIQALVTVSEKDDRGRAWFINRDQVPPMVRIRARVRPVSASVRGWHVSVRDDPIVPGKRGEAYWTVDPFADSSARKAMGSQVGWRKAPGVVWSDLRIIDRTSESPTPPTVSPVQRIRTGDRGGCWLALGDLDGDGRLDYLVARNDAQRVTALTAYANSGEELWRWGEGGSANIGYDVPAIIYDIDRDDHAEALCSIEGYLLVLEGATGQEKARWPLPEGLAVADCIVIANLRGLDAPADLLVKTRYDRLWAYTNEWEPLWEWSGNTGHHPDVRDVDGDGRDEVLCGFTLIDDDGTVLWQQDLPGHADAARLLELGGLPRALSSCCGGNDLALTGLDGELLWRQQPDIMDFHWQTVHVGELRPDIPGQEIIVDEGWARPGRSRLTLLTERGEWVGCYYVSYPRFHRIIDWDGDGVMEVAIPSDDLICDGRGRPIVALADGPSLGGPGVETPMCHVADVLGDGRDELVVFNAEEIAIYANPSEPKAKHERKPAVMKRHYNATYY